MRRPRQHREEGAEGPRALAPRLRRLQVHTAKLEKRVGELALAPASAPSNPEGEPLQLGALLAARLKVSLRLESPSTGFSRGALESEDPGTRFLFRREGSPSLRERS